MEELEKIYSMMWPANIYFLKRDPRIKLLLKDGYPDEILYINTTNLKVYLNGIHEKTEQVLAHFTEILTHNDRATIIYESFYRKATTFIEDFKEFRDKVLEGRQKLAILYQSLDAFVDGTDFEKIEESYFNDLDVNKQEELKKYIEVTLKYSERIVQRINELNPSKTETSGPNKIKFNHPVGEIALLFRLLLENKTIEAPNKEELFRQISTFFESSRAETISVNSLRKKFHDPDATTSKELDVLLVNLRQVLKKIQNN